MLKREKHTKEVRPRLCALLLATIFFIMGVIIGSTSSNSFSASTEKSFHQLMNDAMTLMDRGMKNAPMTGDLDHDFAAMMIPHHQGAVDMAKAELIYGKDPVLRRLAQEIVVTQEQEIVVMSTRLKHVNPQ
jgi:uncharacterized protein (DUF305 family)